MSLCRCGSWKSKEAKECRACRTIHEKLMAMDCAISTKGRKEHTDKKVSTCPTCGNAKSNTSKQCIVCYTKSLPDNRHRLVCPVCGGKKHSAAIMCRSCRTKLQWKSGLFKSHGPKKDKPISDMWYIGAGSTGGKRRP